MLEFSNKNYLYFYKFETPVTFTYRRSDVLFICRSFRSVWCIIDFLMFWSVRRPRHPPADEKPSAHYPCSLIIYFAWSKNANKTVGTGVKTWIIAISKETEMISRCNILKHFSRSAYRVVQEYQQL